MEVTMLETSVLNEMRQDIKDIKSLFNKPHTQSLSEQWVDIPTACSILHISIRTCAKYRYDGVIPYSQFADKIYFKVADLQTHLEKHYVPAFKNTK